jgi:hypothetical protein
MVADMESEKGQITFVSKKGPQYLAAGIGKYKFYNTCP